MSSHQITPNETHVIKAMAWDALETALNLGTQFGQTDEEKTIARKLLQHMDSMLVMLGNKVSKSSTWELGMAKKFKNDDYFKCVACGTATPKKDWIKAAVDGFHICPHCGGMYIISVGNEIPEPIQEPDAPEPKADKPKPKTAKK